MDKQKFNEMITSIGTCESDEERRTLLAEMQNDINSIFTSNEELAEKNKNLTDDNEALRSANMRLFLQVGSPQDEKTTLENSTGLKDQPKEKRSFNDLFSEKGGLK